MAANYISFVDALIYGDVGASARTAPGTRWPADA